MKQERRHGIEPDLDDPATALSFAALVPPGHDASSRHALETRGLWLVVPDDPTVEQWPTTPTAVFRACSEILPYDHEVARR